MSTAELKTPVAIPSTPAATPAPETTAAPPTPEANGTATVEKPARPRDESGKFRQKDAVERFREKKAAREGTAPAAAAPSAPAAKPAEKPAAAPTPAPVAEVEDPLLSRAEEVGMTRYEAKKHGANLEKEIARRAEEKRQADIDRLVDEKLKALKPQNTEQTPSKSQADADDVLAKLTDLPPEYGDDMVSRDKLLREELQRSRDELRQLHSLRDEVNALKQHTEEERQRQEREAQIASATKFDKVLEKLPQEFIPVFGKGSYETIGSTPYLRTRAEAYELTTKIEALRPDQDYEKTAQAAIYALYPDLMEAEIERRVADRARKSAARVTAGAGTNGGMVSGFDGPLAAHPGIQARIGAIRAKKQGA